MFPGLRFEKKPPAQQEKRKKSSDMINALMQDVSGSLGQAADQMEGLRKNMGKKSQTMNEELRKKSLGMNKFELAKDMGKYKDRCDRTRHLLHIRTANTVQRTHSTF